jgi:PAS domain S-box-containing protein
MNDGIAPEPRFGDLTVNVPRMPDVSTAHQLPIVHEELTVAEEELRVQNDELSSAVDRLIRERQRYRDLFLHAAVPYMVTDLSGNIREVNRAMCELLGRRCDHLLGKPWVVFTHQVSRRRIRAVLQRLSVGGRRARLRAKLEIGARRIPIEATVVAGSDACGGAGELRWIVTDDRPRRRLEHHRRQQAERLESLVTERTTELR